MAEETAEQEKKTYRVKPGQRYAHLTEGETVELTATEAAPFLEELELVKPDAKKAPPKSAPD